MSHIEKLSIALTPEMATAIRQCVESGEYTSSSEVVREALHDWKLKRSIQQNEMRELRSLWQAGLESGRGHLADMAEIKHKARQRVLAQKIDQS